jgi:Spy/CpxP family protein refolding chaperone
MKKLIIAALLVVGLSAFAQDKEMGKSPDRAPMEKLTPEQHNELMLKKMTLDLDLNAKQQEQMKKIIAEQSVKREAMRAARKANQEKPTTDERFTMKSKMLDEQIAMKNKMKNILTPEQFEKWNAMKDKQHQRSGHRGFHDGQRKEALKK